MRPFIFDAVNIAQIRVNSPLNIANIAVGLDLSENKNATVEMYVMRMIQSAFSKPTNNSDDYIPSQIIAEYLKNLGYDGIRYNSSLHFGGVNLTIFNHEKCEAISSQDFRIEDIKLTARAAFGCADNQGDLAYIKDNEPLYLDYEKLISIKSNNINSSRIDKIYVFLWNLVYSRCHLFGYPYKVLSHLGWLPIIIYAPCSLNYSPLLYLHPSPYLFTANEPVFLI